MARSVPWRPRCPAAVQARIAAVDESRLLVVQAVGPACFVLKARPPPAPGAGGAGGQELVAAGEVSTRGAAPPPPAPGGGRESRRSFKVVVGDPVACSGCSVARDGPCIHVLFVLLKVFRVPPTSPLLWQGALLDAEVEQLTDGRAARAPRVVAAPARQRSTAAEAGGAASGPTRKAIGDGDSCPICCDDLAPPPAGPATDYPALVHCRASCGNNVHAECFQEYAAHARGQPGKPAPLLCPLCRAHWSSPATQEASRGPPCAACRVPVTGAVYRCAFCRAGTPEWAHAVHLCAACFAAGHHAEHPFDCQPMPGAPFRPARRAGGGGSEEGVASAAHLELMNRSLGPEDFELLLALDGPAGPHPPKAAARAVLSAAEVRRLPRYLVQPGDGDHDCPVCAVEADPAAPVPSLELQPCGHKLHAPCAHRWLTRERAACPLCLLPVIPPAVGPDPDSAPFALTAAGVVQPAHVAAPLGGSIGPGPVAGVRRRANSSRPRQPPRPAGGASGLSLVVDGIGSFRARAAAPDAAPAVRLPGGARRGLPRRRNPVPPEAEPLDLGLMVGGTTLAVGSSIATGRSAVNSRPSLPAGSTAGAVRMLRLTS